METGELAKIKAWLDGDPSDLHALSVQLDHGDYRVIYDADKDAYYLTAPEIDSAISASAYYGEAAKLITYVNGIGRVANAGHRPVGLTGRFAEGDKEHTVIAPQAAEFRIHLGMPTITMTGPDGTVVPPPPSPWPARIAAIASNPDVAQVLEIMANPPLDGNSLYKVREIVNRSVDSIQGNGKVLPIIRLGWTDKATDWSFRGSVNDERVAGKHARHARSSGTPPKNPMDMDQAREYIRKLVINWLDWLSSQEQP